MYQYDNCNYNRSYTSSFQSNFGYEETLFSTPFKTFVRNGKFSRNIPPQPSNIVIQSCIVCHLPIQANWMTTNIQVHGHCFQHIYGEAILLQNDNNRLKREVAELRDQVENFKMKERIKDFLGKSTDKVDPVESVVEKNSSSFGRKTNLYPNNFSTNSNVEQITHAQLSTEPRDNYCENRTIAYKVAVGNLPAEQLDTTRSVLKEAFSKFGTINKIWINPINKLYGYIEFNEKDSAEIATQSMNGQRFLGKTLEVEMPFLSLIKEANQPSKNVFVDSNDKIELSDESNDSTLSSASNTSSTSANNNESTSGKETEICRQGDINDQKKKIQSLKQIVDSQKQVIMKYRNSLKNYGDRSDYGTLSSNISLTKVSLTCSKASVLKEITNEMKEDICRIQENLGC